MCTDVAETTICQKMCENVVGINGNLISHWVKKFDDASLRVVFCPM